MSDTTAMARMARSIRGLDPSELRRVELVRDNLRRRSGLWRLRSTAVPPDLRRAFVMGCGRSGTTVLGRMLASHPEVTYLEEPKGPWSLVNPCTDIWRRFWPSDGGGLLDTSDVDARTVDRFNRLFQATTPVLIDKSPEHTFLVPFIVELDASARFVHIVRDGTAVAESIARKSQTSVRIVGSRRYNDWWGLDDAKWDFLRMVAARRGYLVREVAGAATDAERGLCEWLLSLNEVRIHRELLGDRLLEVRYCDLVADPKDVLVAIGDFLGLCPSPSWVAEAAAMVSAPEDRRVPCTEDPVLLAELERAHLEWKLG